MSLLGPTTVEVKADPGINEATVTALVDRLRYVLDHTAYASVNPKLARVKALYRDLHQGVTQGRLDALTAEVERLEATTVRPA